jgi:hypothetical protein
MKRHNSSAIMYSRLLDVMGVCVVLYNLHLVLSSERCQEVCAFLIDRTPPMATEFISSYLKASH